MQIDPTRTTMLRLQYSRQLTRLYRKFGITVIPRLTYLVTSKQNKFKTNHKTRVKTTRAITNDIDRYLGIEIEKQIFIPAKGIVRRNIKQAYKKGANKALSQLTDAQINNITPADWDAFLLLEDINFNRIIDCTNNMERAISYSCQRGILEGWGTSKIGREIRRNVKGNNNMGIVRAKMIARTEIINAYNVAAQNKYKQNGVPHYIWITGFDERTCVICSGYDGMIFRVGKGVVPPVHPNCRCSTSPIYKEVKL